MIKTNLLSCSANSPLAILISCCTSLCKSPSVFCPFSDSIRSPTLMPSTYALLFGLIWRCQKREWSVINSGSRFCTQRGAGVEKMFAVAGSEFVWGRKNTWTRYRPCPTCQMVIKIHIYISKEVHMVGKSFTPLKKKIHSQQWYLLRKHFCEA